MARDEARGETTGRGRARRRPALLMLPLLLLAACAPTVRGAGPWIQPAELAPDRVIVSDGTELALTSWPAARKPPRAVILAVHGFNDYANAFAGAAARWAERGIATYAYDQRGFGASGPRGIWAGAKTLAADLVETARLIARRHPNTPLYLLGESMGAAVVLLAAAGGELPPETAGVILSAPAAEAWRSLGLLARSALWLTAHTMPWWTSTGRGLGIVASDNVEMLRALARDPLVVKETRIDAVYGLAEMMDDALAAAPRVAVPTLLLYGAHDDLVSREAFDALAGALGMPARRVVYPAGYHLLLRDLQADRVIADIAAWIEDRAGPLPSGDELATGEGAR